MPDKFNRDAPPSAHPSDSGIDPGLAIGQRSPDSRSTRGDEDNASSQRNPVAPRGTEAFQGTSDAELAEVEDDFSTSEDTN
jgi:hypothetical protein